MGIANHGVVSEQLLTAVLEAFCAEETMGRVKWVCEQIMTAMQAALYE